jgi:futalosine hydrolase
MNYKMPLELSNGISFSCNFAFMKILIVSATQMEVDIAREQLKNSPNISFHITGVGMLLAAVSLTKLALTYKPELIIQVGIAGCFDISIELGKVVFVKEEILGDMGVEENGEWKDLFKTKFIAPNDAPFTNCRLVNKHLSEYNHFQLPEVTAITINEITTRSERIAQLKSLYNPTVESMEGAALHYVCNDFDIPYLQIRGLSNYIGERDKSKWRIKEAVENTNRVLIETVAGIKL